MTTQSRLKRLVRALPSMTALAMVLAAATLVSAQAPPPAAPAAPVAFLAQGDAWTPELRQAFYTQDQGSRLIPLAWAKALTTGPGGSGQPFLSGSLSRYGYIPNPLNEAGLPVGFTLSGPQGGEYLGMTCAACHTRQIEVDGQAYRADGGPALSDFHALLTDLRDAVGRARANFAPFAATVLGPNATADQVKALKSQVDLWYLRQDTLFTHALPPGGWGVGRLDAVSMIFDRLTGLDIGPTPDRILVDNIKLADAPVRYPFIWNASRQDFTQWPGFAPNGDDIFGLIRNLGEVYGVFADFAPRKDPGDLLKANFLAENSANFDGLARLETLIRKIGPPKWPFAIVPEAAERGQAIFGTDEQHPGQCWSCHGIRPGVPRVSLQSTWKTPLQDTGTDSREYAVLNRTAATGVMAGTGLPLARLKANEPQFSVLKAATVGAIAQKYTPFAVARSTGSQAADTLAGQVLSKALPPSQKSLLDFSQVQALSPPKEFKYESRVLQGIWATAPYLHNGSVPTLADLLEPAEKRPVDFDVGRAYDIARVGLAKVQTGQPSGSRHTTGCEDRNSGNSRCGHPFGTTLSGAQKLDLLEYLKTL